jgi:hypothetical protein
MKRLIFVSMVAWLTFVTCTCVFAATRGGEKRAVLQGLEGVRVVVERLKPEIERDGLFGSTLQTDAELSRSFSMCKGLRLQHNPYSGRASHAGSKRLKGLRDDIKDRSPIGHNVELV